ncbi:hypothetical protein P5673_014334 [Acropora cervicornis]|uniref:Uncharacterized protein n=1 Tax=Acropora cervicornis TaxID=6130 RepID=A0AAD9QJW5_ACRCE|nr:hypothetical protein P5673_014334 [Acropora cervicornis]
MESDDDTEELLLFKSVFIKTEEETRPIAGFRVGSGATVAQSEMLSPADRVAKVVDVRDLPFESSAESVQSVCSVFGEVYSVQLVPSNSDLSTAVSDVSSDDEGAISSDSSVVSSSFVSFRFSTSTVPNVPPVTVSPSVADFKKLVSLLLTQVKFGAGPS